MSEGLERSRVRALSSARFEVHHEPLHPNHMKALSVVLVSLFALAAFAPQSSAQTAATPAGLAGTWNYVIETPDGSMEGTIVLRQENGALAGVLNSNGQSLALEKAVLEAAALAFELATDHGRATVNLALNDGGLSGQLSLPDYGTFPMRATRRLDGAEVAAAPAGGTAKAVLSTNSKLKDLFASTQAKAVLDKHLPGLTTSPEVEQALEMSLREIAPYAPDFFTDEALRLVDEDLAKL